MNGIDSLMYVGIVHGLDLAAKSEGCLLTGSHVFHEDVAAVGVGDEAFININFGSMEFSALFFLEMFEVLLNGSFTMNPCPVMQSLNVSHT